MTLHAVPGRRRAAGVVAAALVLSGAGLTGCGPVKAVQKVRHNVDGNKATIGAFTKTLKSGSEITFTVTYVTTGRSPSTIVYAVKPPQGVLFTDTPSAARGGGGAVSSEYVVANSSGEYSCSRSSSGSSPGWSCQKLGKASAAVHNALFSIYTPSHWIAFLKGFSVAAGIVGAKVTTSTLSRSGFSMRCVDFHTPGTSGTSRICTTAQGILGYVKIAPDTASFQIKSYSASPAASLFELPAGAKITNSQAGTS